MSGIHLRGHACVFANVKGVAGALAGAKHCGVMAAKSLVLPRSVNMWSQNRAPSGQQPTVLGSNRPVRCPATNSWQQARSEPLIVRNPECIPEFTRFWKSAANYVKGEISRLRDLAAAPLEMTKGAALRAFARSDRGCFAPSLGVTTWSAALIEAG